MKTLSFAVILSSLLLSINPVLAKTIKINFAKGSYCGSYQGKIKVNDVFLVNIGKEHQLIIKNKNAHNYSVISPTGKILPLIQSYSKTENQYWTGKESGDFKIRIDSIPSGLNADLQICAYQGEGEL